ncbi:MAG: hypothetical protein KC493_07470 [Bacteriovoracaceae bacterium]|nr:hypothetical protein [Bacteriovoracaceae bacterium]
MKAILDKINSFLFPVPQEQDIEAIDFREKFISLSINKNLTEHVRMNKVIQLEDFQGSSTQFILFKENNHILSKSYKDKKLLTLSQQEDKYFNQKYVEKVAQAFHFSIEMAKSTLEIPSEITSDLVSETRGLEWIKATLIVLKSAVQKSREDNDFIFEAQFFSGQRTPEEHFQIRIQCLSLDFLLEFLHDGRLRISSWDYKNLKPDSKLPPLFTGEFVKLKQPVFNEFIHLLAEMSKAATKF